MVKDRKEDRGGHGGQGATDGEPDKGKIVKSTRKAVAVAAMVAAAVATAAASPSVHTISGWPSARGIGLVLARVCARAL